MQTTPELNQAIVIYSKIVSAWGRVVCWLLRFGQIFLHFLETERMTLSSEF